MEAMGKRRASTEVQELMNAVKNDYDFFARFDSAFQGSASPKRQRSLSDNDLVQCAVVRPKPRYHEGFNLDNKERGKPNKYDTLQTPHPREHQTYNRLLSRGQELSYGHKMSHEHRRKSLEQHGQSRAPSEFLRDRLRDQTEKSHEREQLFQKTTPDFWASHGEGDLLRRRHQRSQSQRRLRGQSSDPWPEMAKPEEFICLSSPTILLRDADEAVAWKRRHSFHEAKRLETVVEIPDHVPTVLPRVDRSIARAASTGQESSEDEPRELRKRSQSTKITLGGSSSCEQVEYGIPRETQRLSIEKEQERVKKTVNVEKEHTTVLNVSDSDSEGELIIVDSPNPISCQSSTNQKLGEDNSANHQKPQDDCLTSSQTNEKQSKELQIERTSSDSGSPTTLSPSSELWPDYVITRVGSLLWLDKEIVYPITLDEMRRRIQDPENFSFQMLIAYVRHSRAKGRQFLDYWKCQPSGKTSRPNVLSKLCEADAKELVNGIQKVNEEYFPRDKLARNAAMTILHEKENMLTESDDGEKVRDSFVQEKVEAIEKSRSIFKVLQKTLSNTENDEVFNTFNVASHNAGLANIKNSLEFLDGIFKRIQSHVKGGNKDLPRKNLPALTV